MPALPIDTDQIVITASRAPRAAKRERPPASPSSTSKRDRAARRAAGPCPAAADAVGGGHHIGPAGLAHRSPHPRLGGQPHLVLHRRHQDQRSRVGRHAALRAAQRRPRLAHRGRPWPAIGAVGLGRDRRRDRRQRRSTMRRAMARRPKAARSASRARASRGARRPRASLAGAVGWQRATGIDSFGGPRRQGRVPQPVGPLARDTGARLDRSSSARRRSR